MNIDSSGIILFMSIRNVEIFDPKGRPIPLSGEPKTIAVKLVKPDSWEKVRWAISARIPRGVSLGEWEISHGPDDEFVMSGSAPLFPFPTGPIVMKGKFERNIWGDGRNFQQQIFEDKPQYLLKIEQK